MTAVLDRPQDAKSAADRDIYDETPQDVLDLFTKLGLADDARREELARIANLSPVENAMDIRWIHTRAI